MGLTKLLSSFPSSPVATLLAPLSPRIGTSKPSLRLHDDDGDDALSDAPLEPVVERVEVRIEGMTCGACVASIEGCMTKLPGIVSVKIALLAERGIVEYDPSWKAEDGVKWDHARVLEVRQPSGLTRRRGWRRSACPHMYADCLPIVCALHSHRKSQILASMRSRCLPRQPPPLT